MRTAEVCGWKASQERAALSHSLSQPEAFQKTQGFIMLPRTVVIIEDDSTLLRGLRDNFQAHGFEVRTARDGEQGLQTLLADPPDLVLLDIMLPKINGYEVCRSVRLEKLDMPIIMLTAKGQEEDIVRGLELGADDYVTKPFSIRELLARANAFLRRRQANDSV